MHIARQPETRSEYYYALKEFESAIAMMEDGNFSSCDFPPSLEMEKELQDAYKIREQLLEEAFALFGVVSRSDVNLSALPKGMISYHDWCEKIYEE